VGEGGKASQAGDGETSRGDLEPGVCQDGDTTNGKPERDAPRHSRSGFLGFEALEANDDGAGDGGHPSQGLD